MARKSLTFVPVDPVINRSPSAAKRGINCCSRTEVGERRGPIAASLFTVVPSAKAPALFSEPSRPSVSSCDPCNVWNSIDADSPTEKKIRCYAHPFLSRALSTVVSTARHDDDRCSRRLAKSSYMACQSCVERNLLHEPLLLDRQTGPLPRTPRCSARLAAACRERCAEATHSVRVPLEDRVSRIGRFGQWASDKYSITKSGRTHAVSRDNIQRVSAEWDASGKVGPGSNLACDIAGNI